MQFCVSTMNYFAHYPYVCVWVSESLAIWVACLKCNE